MAFLLFLKAYDIVCEEIFLKFVIGKVLGNKCVLWISSFIVNPLEKVLFNESSSRKCKFYQGLPQGSVPAQLFFILYTNGFNEIIEVSGKHRTGTTTEKISCQTLCKFTRRI